MKRILKHTWIVALPLLAGLIGLTACEIDSSESVTRDVAIIVAGYYSDSLPMVRQNTGASIRNMNLRQNGDQLEGVDNNNNVFRGTLGQVTEGTTASFTLEGYTTAGNKGIINGTFSVSGEQSTMRGTWVEDSLYSAVYATATVPTNSPVDPPNTNETEEVTINASPATINVSGSSLTSKITVSGGVPGYTLSRGNNTYGSLSSESINSSGGSVTYTANSGATGNQTVTAKDSDGNQKSVTITQNNG